MLIIKTLSLFGVNLMIGEQGDEVLRSARRGNREAFGLLVKKYQHLVYSAVYNIVRNAYTAEDITQETFVKAYLSIADQTGDFKSWICRIAVNKSIDSLRSRRTESEPREDIADKSMGAEDSLIAREEERQLAVYIRELPPEYREAIIEIYVKGTPAARYAEEKSIPVRTVETRLYRAKKMIRERRERDER